MVAEIDTAMILAAGLGTRMRPITLHMPKPMVPVMGRAMIDHTLDRLAAAGVHRAVVNVHYLADMLEAHLLQGQQDPKSLSDFGTSASAARSVEGGAAHNSGAKGEEIPQIEIVISDERTHILDSGGGIAKALPLINRDVFYLCNSDTVWIDGASSGLQRLRHYFDPARMDAVLLLAATPHTTGYEGRGDFHLAQDGTITRRAGVDVAPFVYTGVAILKASLFHEYDVGSAFSLNRIFNTLIAQERLHGVRLEGLWMHVGMPESITEAETAWQAYYRV